MSTTTTDRISDRTSRVILLCGFLVLLAISSWGLWQQLTVGWDTQWSYADVFHDPKGPTAALPPEMNHAQNIVHAVGFGLAALASAAGVVYQGARLRAARRREH